MIAIIDYGVGNLFSLKSSFERIGAEITVTKDADTIKNADKIVLPGVGAFEDAARKLREAELDGLIIDQAKGGKPLLGICLGMQMLLEKSYEYGEHEGLGLIKGQVRPIEIVDPEIHKVPHIGWNALRFENGKSPLFKYIEEGDCVYFVHSYHGTDCKENTIATVEYGIDVTAAVACDNVMGTQFHPEKSGKVGLNILKAFCEM